MLSFGAATCKCTILFHVLYVAVFTISFFLPIVAMLFDIWIVFAGFLGCYVGFLGCRVAISTTTVQLVDFEKVRFIHSIVLSQSAFLGGPNFIIRATDFGHGGFVTGFLESPCSVLHHRGCIVGASLVRATLALSELTVHA